MKFKLKGGIVAEVNPLSRKDKAEEMLAFMAALIREKPQVFINTNRTMTIADERKWLKEKLKTQGKTHFMLVARVNGKIAGTTDARRGTFHDEDKINLGISIALPYRGIGLGKVLLQEVIRHAKKLFKPRVIYLGCVTANKPAHALYHKLGFREFARFKKWQKHRGKYEDMIFLKLGK